MFLFSIYTALALIFPHNVENLLVLRYNLFDMYPLLTSILAFLNFYDFVFEFEAFAY
jgi:hypothetical protein